MGVGRMPDDRSTVRADAAVRVPGGPPLLASRLTPAVPPEPMVLRPRLARLLDEAVTRPATLLRAPAGWGKTTLLATWRRARQDADPQAPVPAWVSVEAGDDPDRLWSYLGAALRSVVGPAEPPLPDRVPRPDELELLAAALAARERPAVLIVDDLHRVTEPAALAGLEFLLRHSEQRLRLVAAGRTGSPLAVHRLRLAGELTELGPDDLAFTGDEIADLLTAHGVAVPAAAVARLRQRTGGWAAVLRIAALALRDQPDPERWISELGADQPEIAGYLRAEPLGGLEPKDRELLRRAAIVDAVCAGLATALSGDADTEERLSTLADDSGLLHHDGGRPVWYRCHPLLADLLHRELVRLPPEELRDLHLRATGWYAGNGRPAEALRHALAAGDWTAATDLFVTRWPELVPYERPAGAGSAPTSPPPEEVGRDPELALACATERALDGDTEAAVAYLRLATGHTGRLPQPRRSRFGRLVTVVELTLARLAGDPQTVRSAAARLLDTGGGRPTGGPELASAGAPSAGHAAEDADVRAVAGTALALLALDDGELTGAATGLAEALAAARTAARPRTELVCASRWSVVSALRGVAGGRGDGSGGVGPAVLPGLVGAARLRVRAPGAGGRRAAPGPTGGGRGTPGAGRAGRRRTGCRRGRRLVPRVPATRRGELSVGHRLLVEARTGWGARGGELGSWLRAAEVDLHSARGDVQTARELAGDRPTGPVTGAAAAMAVAAARTELRAGDPRAAESLLPDWTAAPTADWPLPVRLDAALLATVLAVRAGDDRRAGRMLEQALDLAAPEGYRRPFLRAEPGLRELLAAHLDSGTAHWSLVSDLVRVVDAPAGPAGGTATAPLDEPLTERELTILRYLQSILSNVEIAAELSVSVNTVKTHVRNIYRKLDATRRRDAVRRARQLHLI
ncbi:hypothetical protein GCM10029963_64680 [Micromonospora andamanensis]